MNRLLQKLSLFLAFLLLSYTVFSQGSTTSSMTGRIVDNNGQPLPGATIVAVHEPSGTQYGIVTNTEGFFNLQGMRIGGPYSIEVTFVGYSKKTFTDITLRLGEPFVVNTDLTETNTELGEVIVVGVRPSAFSSEKTGASTNISNREISTLPSISRSINDFTRLSPLYGGGNSFAGRDGRFNNIVIDGANFNNNFGLSSRNMPGGDAEPVSLDAIEEIQVNIAPFDVRQANFTGAGINAVTKSGTNTFKGTVYGFYRDQSFNGLKVSGEKLDDPTPSATKIIGASVGGPIIENKLFFFLNGEFENSSRPGMEWLATRPGVTGTNVSRVPADSLEKFSDLLYDNFGYVTGPYEKYGSFLTKNYKILARIDWNINQNHKFSLRYNKVENNNDQLINGKSSPNPRASSDRTSADGMSFQNSNYGFLNTVSSISAELRSNFGGKFSNQFLTTYSRIQDTRSSNSDIFPFIDIWDGTGQQYMAAGYELFSYNNDVLNKVFTITDNFTYNSGRHTVTAGVSYESLYFGNSFMRYGTSYYRYADLEAFEDNITGGPSRPIAFGITYSLLPGGELPVADLNFGQFSAYLQDEYNVIDNVKVTAGVRIDLPLYLNELIENPAVSALTFADGQTINTGLWPDSKILWSPRVGFSWDVKGDKSLKVRGGTGIFTGRLPFVYFTNQPTNSGMLQNTVEITNAGSLANLDFNEDPAYHLSNTTLFPTTAGTSSPGSLAAVDPGFKMPQVWRSSLAADIKLPLDMTLTLEGLYTNDLNAIVQTDINQADSDPSLTFAGPDDRPIWGNSNALRRVNPAISNAMVMTNTDQGYSYAFTAQLEFPVVTNLRGMLAYTAAMSKDITGNPGSQASSAWANNASVRGQNDLDLSYSQYLTPHRLVGALSYRIEYANMLATTISVYYNGYIDGNFSYTYSNDFNQDGVTSDLLYIPKDATEITFAATADFTAQEQSDAFFAFVDQDKYLSKHMGEYAERNGAFYPWYNRFDVKILQDISLIVGGKKNTLQLSVDILNAANMLNSNWGVHKSLVVSDGAILRRQTAGTPVTAPTFTMTTVGGELPTETFRDEMSTYSTWGIQLGLRYIFN